MTIQNKIFEDIKKLQKEIEKVYNDNELWKDIYDNIHDSYLKIQKDKRIYGW